VELSLLIDKISAEISRIKSVILYLTNYITLWSRALLQEQIVILFCLLSENTRGSSPVHHLSSCITALHYISQVSFTKYQSSSYKKRPFYQSLCISVKRDQSTKSLGQYVSLRGMRKV
jgi:hypothetical protein